MNFLYSVNSWIAYALGEEFFGDTHFVWCSEYFDPSQESKLLGRSPPPSSSPKEILAQLAKDVTSNDRHSAKIKSVREGLIKGIRVRLAAREITATAASIAEDVVNQAEIRDFEPVLYVIDRKAVASRLIIVPIADKATPFSSEFKIERLHRSEFDPLMLTS